MFVYAITHISQNEMKQGQVMTAIPGPLLVWIVQLATVGAEIYSEGR